jgi:hypothetical protein
MMCSNLSRIADDFDHKTQRILVTKLCDSLHMAQTDSFTLTYGIYTSIHGNVMGDRIDLVVVMNEAIPQSK